MSMNVISVICSENRWLTSIPSILLLDWYMVLTKITGGRRQETEDRRQEFTRESVSCYSYDIFGHKLDIEIEIQIEIGQRV